MFESLASRPAAPVSFLPLRDKRKVELSGRILPGGSNEEFTESQIVGILMEAESGVAVNEIWRKHGISSVTYYKWKAKYGGLEVSELVRVKELEAENSQIWHNSMNCSRLTQRNNIAKSFYPRVRRL